MASKELKAFTRDDVAKVRRVDQIVRDIPLTPAIAQQGR